MKMELRSSRSAATAATAAALMARHERRRLPAAALTLRLSSSSPSPTHERRSSSSRPFFSRSSCWSSLSSGRTMNPPPFRNAACYGTMMNRRAFSSASSASSSNNNDADDEDVVKVRFVHLEQSSRQVLLSTTKSHRELERLLEEWSDLLPKLSAMLNDDDDDDGGGIDATTTTAAAAATTTRTDWEELLTSVSTTRDDDSSSSNNNSEPEEESLVAIAIERMGDLYAAWKQQLQKDNSGFPSSSSNRPFVALLSAYSKHHPTSGPRALQVLNDWTDRLSGDLELSPSGEHYAWVLRSYAADPRHAQEAPDVAQEILENLSATYTMQPDHETYAAAVACLSHAIQDLSPMWKNLTETLVATERHSNLSSSEEQQQEKEEDQIRRDDLLHRLQEVMDHLLLNCEEKKRQQSGVLLKHFAATAGGLSSDEQQQCAAALLQATGDALKACAAAAMEDRDSSVEPPWASMSWRNWYGTWKLFLVDQKDRLSRDSFSKTITAVQQLFYLNGWLDGGDSLLQSAREMTALLELSESLFPNDTSIPTPRQYSKAVRAWRLCVDGNEEEPRVQQQRILQRMKEQHENRVYEKLVDGRVATDSCNQLMQACYEAGMPEGTIGTWKDMSNPRKGRRIRKDAQSYTLVLQALAAETGDHPQHRAEHAHKILQKMIQTYRSHERPHAIRPSQRHFASVMTAWSRSRHPRAAVLCQQVFDQLLLESKDDPTLKPRVEHYTALITAYAWSRLPDKNRTVMNILRQMNSDPDIKLDLTAYSAVLFALSRSDGLLSPLLAEQILEEMKNRRSKGEPHTLVPTVKSYNSVMYAWANSRAQDAPHRCEAVFEELVRDYHESGQEPTLRPDSITYITLIESWISARYSDPSIDSGRRAEEILDRMEANAQEGVADPPSKRVYTAVMKAYWKQGEPDAALKVEGVLKRMTDAYEAGNATARPDAHAMATLLYAWARSGAPNKATIAWNILENMRDAFNNGDLSMRPTAYHFGAVINACAHTRTEDANEKLEAVKVALMAMNELDSGAFGGPNQYTFRELFFVVGNQIDDMKERERIASVIFHRCCLEGSVSSSIIRAVRTFVPGLYKDLPVDSEKNLRLPDQWTRKVAEYEKRREQKQDVSTAERPSYEVVQVDVGEAYSL